MSVDRELLELAAKAAGLRLEWDGDPRQWIPIYYDGKSYHAWNPLTDDGDALRLAAKLKIDLCFDNGGVDAVWIDEDISETHTLRENAAAELDGMDAKLAATRRAIVRAAAEIGKEME